LHVRRARAASAYSTLAPATRASRETFPAPAQGHGAGNRRCRCTPAGRRRPPTASELPAHDQRKERPCSACEQKESMPRMSTPATPRVRDEAHATRIALTKAPRQRALAVLAPPPVQHTRMPMHERRSARTPARSHCGDEHARDRRPDGARDVDGDAVQRDGDCRSSLGTSSAMTAARPASRAPCRRRRRR